ncbi:hypothetical protein [Clostridium perfringens]|uniref:hypothetical protein n=1 Tax=Clostridium perfringens TaxID=1502 RepID=UPI001240B2CC|nr:hypothetical protein [Clostridium perfringens]MDK0979355.1 hypothetical protein [Clostridium perfringens]
MELREIVKLDLKCSNIDVSDEIIDLEIEKAKADVCTYCNISTIPSGLINVVANLAFDYIKLRNQNINNDDKEIKSIEEGDTTITFNSDSTKVKYKENLFNNYLVTLNKFRVMVF